MSINPLFWAMRQRAGSTSAMAVLVTLADYCDSSGRCFPSQSTIAERTYLSRETVNRILKSLEALGLIRKEGKFYILKIDSVTVDHNQDDQSVIQCHTSVILDHSKEDTKCDPTSQMCDLKSQGCDPTSHPSEVPNYTPKETPKKEKVKKEKFYPPDWLPKIPWGEYLAMRDRIRRPMTENAKALAVHKLDELRRGGHDPTAVLQQSIFNSWQGLFAPKDQQNAPNRTNSNQKYNPNRALELALADQTYAHLRTGGDAHREIATALPIEAGRS